MDKKILVVDFECSCWLGRPPEGMRQEIIEMGLCVVDASTKRVTHRENILVKPANSDISRFCTELTGLTREKLNGESAVTFRDAHKRVKEVSALHRTSIMASWGSEDRNYMEKDCEFHGMEYPFPVEGMNVQKAFKKALGLSGETTVSKAVELLGLQFEGKKHCAGDDAYNTAVILSHII